MHNIRELVELSTNYLEKKKVKEPRREAEELLAFLLNRKRLELYFDYDAPLEEKEVARYREWIRRKGEREPLPYITGEVSFLGLKLKVTPDTLIPRQETEILADKILKALPEKPCTIWDLCTGNGCLGLSIKDQRGDCTVKLSDLSKKALSVARENAASSALSVEILEGDLCAPFQGQKADVVICNPPYISPEDYLHLEEEVRLYEPKEALVGGLDFYKRLSLELPPFLNPGAKLFFEIGTGQGEGVDSLFHQSHWKQKRCEKDWGGHDRFFFLEYHPETK
ncbi:MAG: peptide chain release factor N(5)-glutamine methyltransferase [Chlamydiia bacterium]|nr:peptide chain release factor N(5)-glutamine methyltransferase [Chlamydiia bacterium]